MDASDTAVGAVLQQHTNCTCGTWHPISLFSRIMTPAETRYCTSDRELLAVYLSIKHFRHFTDYKPLMFTLNTHFKRYSPRQAHQLDYISQFTSNIHHVHGMDKVVADALSQIETNALLSRQPSAVIFATMQAIDPQIHYLQSSPTSTLVVEAAPLANSSNPLYCNTSTGTQ